MTAPQPEYEISSDPARLDLDVIHGFLRRSYWSPKIPREVVERAVRNSICFGAFLLARAPGAVGAARAVSTPAENSGAGLRSGPAPDAFLLARAPGAVGAARAVSTPAENSGAGLRSGPAPDAFLLARAPGAEDAVSFPAGGGTQVGFARVISDRATFAYVADVFVLEEHRGRGVSKLLMQAVMSHSELQGLRRWSLATRDAHGLYRQFGFTPVAQPERHMEILRRDIYRTAADKRDETPPGK